MRVYFPGAASRFPVELVGNTLRLSDLPPDDHVLVENPAAGEARWMVKAPGLPEVGSRNVSGALLFPDEPGLAPEWGCPIQDRYWSRQTNGLGVRSSAPSEIDWEYERIFNPPWTFGGDDFFWLALGYEWEIAVILKHQLATEWAALYPLCYGFDIGQPANR